MICPYRSWWEDTSGPRFSPMKVHCDASTDFLAEPFSFNIACVDPNVAGKRVHEHNIQLFSSHWPGDDESILLIVTSNVNITNMSNVNAAITGLPDLRRTIWELWARREKRNVAGGLHAWNVTPIFDNNTPARRVQAAMKLHNRTLFWVIYHGQQADNASGAQTPMSGGHGHLLLHDMVTPPTKDMINDIGEELDSDAGMLHPSPGSFPMAKTGFQQFKKELQKRLIRQRQCFAVIGNHALGLFPIMNKALLLNEDVAWLHKHNHIVNPPNVGSLAHWQCTRCRPAAN